MRYRLDIDSDKKPPPHSFCCRCQMPTENSPVGTGRVPGPNGTVEEVRNIVICLMCLELLKSDPAEFWSNGWES